MSEKIKHDSKVDEMIKEQAIKFQYAMLSRLQMDCDYYLGNGGRYVGCLWADTEKEQIKEMRSIYDSLKLKPEWLTLEQIEAYETAMVTEEIKNKVILSLDEQLTNWFNANQQYIKDKYKSDLKGFLRYAKHHITGLRTYNKMYRKIVDVLFFWCGSPDNISTSAHSALIEIFEQQF